MTTDARARLVKATSAGAGPAQEAIGVVEGADFAFLAGVPDPGLLVSTLTSLARPGKS